jgi:anti-anti-sigma regulatory factor
VAYRILRSEQADATVFALSGEMDDQHTAKLQELLALEGEHAILIDLRDITLVGRAAVRFLVGLEPSRIRIVNCPEYVSTWMAAERHEVQSRRV